MDLQDFNSEMLYFEADNGAEVDRLLDEAASQYGLDSERCLLKALALAPKNLSVLVALYRYYYYQHRYPNALEVAHWVMAVVAAQIEFPETWQTLTMAHVLRGITTSFTLVRFYLFALKAAGYLNLRLEQFARGRAMLEKVVELDNADRLGARILLDVLDHTDVEATLFSTGVDQEVTHGSALGR